MPTYEYHCKACDHRMEEFQSITAKPLRKCPACGRNQLERLIGIGAGVIFKGSGFYETDYRSEAYKKAAEAEVKPDKAAPGTSTDSGKTESSGSSTEAPSPKKSADASEAAVPAKPAKKSKAKS